MSTSEILCSRCGTPFPQEKGKPSVTCVVCGQLRPDLDMTLDDDDDVAASSAFGGGGADAALKAALREPVTPAPRSRVVAPQPQNDTPAPVDRPYVSMSEDIGGRRMEAPHSQSLTERIGPVPLVVTPLAAGMAGALKMLSLVDDFSIGAWYAVGTVFLILLVGSLVAGLIASAIPFIVRLRWSILLRVVFVLAAGGAAYMGIREIPGHVQVRENSLPGILLR